MKLEFKILAALVLSLGFASAVDWPMSRADAGRSGYTAESLPAEMHLQWVRKLAHEPRPAWPRSDRMTFDRAYPIISADGMLFYGSSVDCSIHALDSATGEERWNFPTRAPVRFAPAFWK
ncbi:MAG: outer membrane protein assembly factor BamB, partial [Verrucomicrobiales bacterium]